MENQKLQLHPEMNAELRSLIIDFQAALMRLAEYAKEHKTHENAVIDPANYFSYTLYCFYAQPDNVSWRSVHDVSAKLIFWTA